MGQQIPSNNDGIVVAENSLGPVGYAKIALWPIVSVATPVLFLRLIEGLSGRTGESLTEAFIFMMTFSTGWFLLYRSVLVVSFQVLPSGLRYRLFAGVHSSELRWNDVKKLKQGKDYCGLTLTNGKYLHLQEVSPVVQTQLAQILREKSGAQIIGS